MTVLDELNRQISQHHNEIDALCELQQATDAKVVRIDAKVSKIAGVQRKHGTRLQRIEETQRVHTKTLEGHTKTLEEHGEKHDSHDAKLDQIIEMLRTK